MLAGYEVVSGQKINREKTSVYFSRNVNQVEKEAIIQEVGAGAVQQFERYLGLPALIGRSRRSSFNSIKGRIWTKLNGWKEKLLTHAGKEILLKTVVQAIPIYTMSVFRLPKTLIKEINSLMSKFWWGFKENLNKIAWVSWKNLGRKKDNGGLGFRELDCFNMAMLAKQGWRILKFPDSLAARVMREKYFPDSNFLKANLGKRPSFAWRSIWQAKSLLEEGIIWRVGNGSKIKIWEDKWIPSTFSHRIQDPVRVLNREAKVADIINLDTNWWNIPLIEHFFPSGTMEKICSLAISPRTQEDKQVWAGSKSGAFSVRNAYHLEVDKRSRVVGSSSVCASSNSSWSRIWKMKIPRSIILFLWRASNEILPTQSNLFKRKLVPDPLCPMCGIEAETSGHVLWSCDVARAVWGSCGGSIQKSSIVASDFLVIFGYLCDRLDEGELELFAVTAHKIWLLRNSLVFGGPVQSPSYLLKGATEELADF